MPSDAAFQRAAALARASLKAPEADGSGRIRVVAVSRIYNPDRRQHFEVSRAALARKRGNGGVNEVDAFHGTTLLIIEKICGHGFNVKVKARNASQFGVGVYFSPAGTPGKRARFDMMALDPLYSSPDGEGVQHLLLCKVLCGNPEKLKNGGQEGNNQFQPSSYEFDSGVDGPLDGPDTARLVVWGCYANTHVLPQYVVSIRKLEKGMSLGRDGHDPASARLTHAELQAKNGGSAGGGGDDDSDDSLDLYA